MSVTCQACSHVNRANAMFCIGCLARLPAFVATGPSALELIERRRPARAQAPFSRLVLPADSRRFWVQLGLGCASMFLAFLAWYGYVSRSGVPIGSSGQAARWSTPAPATVPVAMTVEPSIEQRLQGAPASSSAVAEAIAEALPAMETTPASAVDAVARFYRALSSGDGRSAAAVVTPAKRGVGPYNEDGMTRFYRSFREPLALQSIRPIGGNLVEARYSYRATASRCEATAIIETEVVAQQTFIRRIRANC